MVNVTHYSHNRRTGCFFTIVINGFSHILFQLVVCNQLRYFVTHFFDDQSCSVLIQRLVNGCHNTHFHQLFDHFTGFHRHLGCQITNRNGFRKLNFTDHWRSWFSKRMLVIRITITAATFSLQLSFWSTLITPAIIVFVIEAAIFVSTLTLWRFSLLTMIVTLLCCFCCCTFLRGIFFRRWSWFRFRLLLRRFFRFNFRCRLTCCWRRFCFACSRFHSLSFFSCRFLSFSLGFQGRFFFSSDTRFFFLTGFFSRDINFFAFHISTLFTYFDIDRFLTTLTCF